MATLRSNNKSVEIADGESVIEKAKEIGIVFGCHNGMCRACECKVISGIENLSEKTDAEEMFNLPEDNRLMCQCRILNGEVEVEQK